MIKDYHDGVVVMDRATAADLRALLVSLQAVGYTPPDVLRNWWVRAIRDLPGSVDGEVIKDVRDSLVKYFTSEMFEAACVNITLGGGSDQG